MEINEIIEKQVKTWQEKDNEKRSVIVIATEDLADNKTVLAMGIMGKAFNLKLAIAKALNANERLPKLLDDGVKLGLVERILSGNTKKEEETK